MIPQCEVAELPYVLESNLEAPLSPASLGHAHTRSGAEGVQWAANKLTQ